MEKEPLPAFDPVRKPTEFGASHDLASDEDEPDAAAELVADLN
jgi:hypothetical protein